MGGRDAEERFAEGYDTLLSTFLEGQVTNLPRRAGRNSGYPRETGRQTW